MASKKRRVLVTGVARWWGALVVQRLVEDPDVAEVIGIDIREPRYDLGRADYLKLDIRHSLIGKLVRAVITGVANPSPSCKVRYGSQVVTIPLASGMAITLDGALTVK